MEILKRIQNLILGYTFIEKNQNRIEIGLPYFFNSGDTLELIIDFQEEDVIIKNDHYKNWETSLSNIYSTDKLRKEYLIPDTPKFEKLVKEHLESYNINHSLLMEKRVSKEEFDENFDEIILRYILSTTRYYNYISDYILSNVKESQRGEAFRTEIQNFLNNFQKKHKGYKFKAIKKTTEHKKTFSSKNLYFESDKIILAGINSKLHLLEALRDLRIIFKEKRAQDKILVVIDNRKSKLNEEYVGENLETLDISEITSVDTFYIQSDEDFEKISKRLIG